MRRRRQRSTQTHTHTHTHTTEHSTKSAGDTTRKEFVCSCEKKKICFIVVFSSFLCANLAQSLISTGSTERKKGVGASLKKAPTNGNQINIATNKCRERYCFTHSYRAMSHVAGWHKREGDSRLARAASCQSVEHVHINHVTVCVWFDRCKVREVVVEKHRCAVSSLRGASWCRGPRGTVRRSFCLTKDGLFHAFPALLALRSQQPVGFRTVHGGTDL